MHLLVLVIFGKYCIRRIIFPTNISAIFSKYFGAVFVISVKKLNFFTQIFFSVGFTFRMVFFRPVFTVEVFFHRYFFGLLNRSTGYNVTTLYEYNVIEKQF